VLLQLILRDSLRTRCTSSSWDRSSGWRARSCRWRWAARAERVYINCRACDCIKYSWATFAVIFVVAFAIGFGEGLEDPGAFDGSGSGV